MRFLFFYLRNNIASALEYRFSFFSQLLGMFINDALWVLFWVFFFHKFPVINNWTVREIMIMWSIVTTSFGLSFGLFANISRLPDLITNGQLDYYLALPKNVLFHVSVSKINPINLGDCVFGPILFAFFVHPTGNEWLAFIFVNIFVSIIFYSFFLLVGSVAFFAGQSDQFSSVATSALIHFSTYPTDIFHGWVKVLLYTALPAGFMAGTSVEIVRTMDLNLALQLVAAALVFFMTALVVFHRGLKRYESGNLILMQQ